MNVDKKLEQALERWIQASDLDLKKLNHCLHVELVDDPNIWASLRHDTHSTSLQVSKGVIGAISQVLAVDHVQSSRDYVLHNMVGFVVLHELAHINLGHFALADSFSVAERSRKEPHIFDVRQFNLPHLVPLCLEMQADHEATDTLLGAYSAEGWHEVREKVLAISGMMMLIELEDIKNGAEGRTHPKAATRVFQLLGHLAEMPLAQAQVEQDASLIPSEEVLQVFARDLTIPCFFDAIQLAQAAGAASIVTDLGSPEDFFKDLEIAKLGDPSRYGELKTQGAQEWAKLWPCNEALKPILGGHFTN